MVHILKHLKRTRDESANVWCHSSGRASLPQSQHWPWDQGTEVSWKNDWELVQLWIPNLLEEFSLLIHRYSVSWFLSPHGM